MHEFGVIRLEAQVKVLVDLTNAWDDVSLEIFFRILVASLYLLDMSSSRRRGPKIQIKHWLQIIEVAN